MNLLIVYDDLDSKRGEYFADSHQDLQHKLKPDVISYCQALNTKDCLAHTIDYYTRNFSGKKFIFIAYTHGTDKSIFVSEENYINESNAYLFNKSLFYACSCHSAKSLGQVLLDNGCSAFLGFNSSISSCNPEAEAIYQDCENTFIEQFLNTDGTIQECLKTMYNKYREMELHLSQNFNLFEASVLSRNLSAFQVLCNDEVRLFTKINFQ